MYIRKGNSCHQNMNTIMSGYGKWGKMSFHRRDGKDFIIPEDITNSEKKTKNVIALLNKHDKEAEERYAV